MGIQIMLCMERGIVKKWVGEISGKLADCFLGDEIEIVYDHDPKTRIVEYIQTIKIFPLIIVVCDDHFQREKVSEALYYLMRDPNVKLLVLDSSHDGDAFTEEELAGFVVNI
jgi:hypothetical protein